MTRKERKRERKLKKFTKSLSDAEKTYLKAVARRMAKLPSPYIDGKHYCPTCKLWYCNNYAGLITFCKNCFYLNGCIRESRSFIICRVCARKEVN